MEAHDRAHLRRRHRLRIELLLAATVFVFGALWTIAVNLGTLSTGGLELAPLIVTAVGGLWYVVTRARLWW